MKTTYIISILFILISLSCKDCKVDQRNGEIIKSISTDLAIDHLNIWVKDPGLAKKRLNDIGFRSVPDSLSQIHKGQGTSGRYFYFLNGYLELIFIHNQKEFELNNNTNKHLDFPERANFEHNGASPFGVALKVMDYNVDKIPFTKIKYHQEWMEENKSIYVAKSSKTQLQDPSIFVVYPEIEADIFETTADLNNIPDEYAIWREFFKHPNGAKKLTNIRITSVGSILHSETIQAINRIKNLTIIDGEKHLMELVFDESIQGVSFDLRPELPLKIHL